MLWSAGLYLFFRLLPDEYQNTKKTWFVLLAAPLLHYLTFIVFPDGPLLFFSLVFLFVYKRFLQKQSWVTAVLMGISLVLMAYSKYHGALVLLFTVLANPKLLKSGYFYLSLFVAAFFFLPHLWWQYQNEFPTLKYHLSGRTSTISFRYVGEYVSQQIVAIGPGLIFVPFVVRTKDVFERTLLFIIIGTFVFFLLTSFKTFVHFHWTSIALFPLLYFAVIYYNNLQKKKVFNYLLLPFIILFFVARILLMFPIIPSMHVGEDYYHGRKEWAKEISSVANGKPVFMTNNLREASLYSFYSGKQGVTLYTRQEKKSQYELWDYEDSLQGKEVMFVAKNTFNGSTPLANNLQQHLYYTFLPFFTSYYHNVSIKAIITRHTDSIEANLEIINHRTTPLLFSKGLNGETTTLIFSIEKGKTIVRADILEHLTETVPPSGSTKKKIRFRMNDLPPGDYHLNFGIRNGILPDAILSNSIQFHQ
ncbi:MAG: hypothetical protein EOO13_00635 [Chitinophagaceae bacterium]|nr:MAG: hypothetical protein EOO13_00635 [Chitinophagaceae bacterium]